VHAKRTKEEKTKNKKKGKGNSTEGKEGKKVPPREKKEKKRKTIMVAARAPKKKVGNRHSKKKGKKKTKGKKGEKFRAKRGKGGVHRVTNLRVQRGEEGGTTGNSKRGEKIIEASLPKGKKKKEKTSGGTNEIETNREGETTKLAAFQKRRGGRGKGRSEKRQAALKMRHQRKSRKEKEKRRDKGRRRDGQREKTHLPTVPQHNGRVIHSCRRWCRMLLPKNPSAENDGCMRGPQNDPGGSSSLKFTNIVGSNRPGSSRVMEPMMALLIRKRQQKR